MKVIDLLNKIANGEEASKFWWNGCIHEVQEEYGTNKLSIFDTYCKTYKRIELEDLNEEIKFLEEDKKIEKLDTSKYFYVGPYTENQPKRYDIDVFNKINEIIDYINKEEK